MRLPILLGLCCLAAACADGSSDSSSVGTPVDPQPVPTRTVPFALRSPGIDYGKHLTTDAVGRVFVTGYFAQSVDFDPSSGTASRTSNGVTDIFLASYEATGVLRWVTSLGGAGVDMTYAVGAEPDGTLRVAGYVSAGASCEATLPSGGARDAFAAVFNAAGRCTSAITIGGTEDDEARGFLIAPDGDWVIAGAFRGTADFDPGAGLMTITSSGEEDLFVARYTSTGSLRWVRTLGSAAGDEGMALSLDDAGNVYVGGFIGGAVDADPGPATVPVSTAGQGDAVVWALSATGGYRWLARWGGTQLDLVNVGELVSDADGTLVVSGTFRGVADLDPGSGVLTAAAIGSSDVFFLRLRRGDGSLVRAASIGGAGLDGSHTLRIDAATGDILSAGWFTGSIDVDPGSGVRTLSGTATSGGTDIWVAQLDRNFTARWGTALTTTGVGETSWSMCTGAAYGLDGAVWLTGRYYGTIDTGADAQGVRVTLANAGESDAFVARLTAADGRLWSR